MSAKVMVSTSQSSSSAPASGAAQREDARVEAAPALSCVNRCGVASFRACVGVRRAAAPSGHRRLRVGHRSRVGKSARHRSSAVAADSAVRAVRHARPVRLAARAGAVRRASAGTGRPTGARSRCISCPTCAGTTAARRPRATSPSRSTRRAIRPPDIGARRTSASIDSVDRRATTRRRGSSSPRRSRVSAHPLRAADPPGASARRSAARAI